jgi:branched-chain amino acid transport system ATP-binding protein
MLAMARALMCHPTLLLLDEPSMGLAPIMVEKIFEVIRDVSKPGHHDFAGRAERQAGAAGGAPRYVMDSG